MRGIFPEPNWLLWEGPGFNLTGELRAKLVDEVCVAFLSKELEELLQRHFLLQQGSATIVVHLQVLRNFGEAILREVIKHIFPFANCVIGVEVSMCVVQRVPELLVRDVVGVFLIDDALVVHEGAEGDQRFNNVASILTVRQVVFDGVFEPLGGPSGMFVKSFG